MKIGILALQGAVEPHQDKCIKLGAHPIMVRRPEHLAGLSGLIFPGGESSTLLKLLHFNELWDSICEFDRPLLGVCAGAILLSKKVTHPEQESLGLVDIEIERNAYGRQLESFVDELEWTQNWSGSTQPISGVFIRAPIIEKVGNAVTPLLMHNGLPVLVEQENYLVGTFHPELSDSDSIHEYFLRKCSTIH